MLWRDCPAEDCLDSKECPAETAWILRRIKQSAALTCVCKSVGEAEEVYSI